MNTNVICASCGKPLDAAAPMGLCPQCLIRSGFSTVATSQSHAAALAKFTPPTLEELAPLFPQLELLELIGKGGMGAVYQARQKQLNRMVALKILPPGIGADPAFAARFTREAQALAQLNHPGIVTLYEFGAAGGLHYFVMEFVDGLNLRQLLASRRVSPREALAIVPQICDALQFAHDQGVVHRDIKPENILIDRRGRVKVADFGLAKLAQAAEEPLAASSAVVPEESLTEHGKILGTPNYMSPEQLEHPADVDHRADIYALGVVFYQMLTGELPQKPLQPPSKKVQVDVRLDDIVLHALESEPSRRYQQVSALKSDVETVSSPAPPRPALAEPPKYSGAAVAGACLAPFFFISMIYWDFGSSGGTQALLGLLATCMGWISILATTVLGWVAIRQIRRSGGRLVGLGIALADALALPLAVLDLVLVFVMVLLNKLINVYVLSHTHPELLDSFVINLWHFAAWLAATAVVVVAADFAVVRLAWRAANRPYPGAEPTRPMPGPTAPPPGRTSRLATAGAALILLYGSAFLVVRHYHGRSDYIGTAAFPHGDYITVDSVARNKARILIKGRYKLVSADEALLALYITSDIKPQQESATQRKQITRGEGRFELVHPHPVPGLPHVSMYATDGGALAHLYFGTKKESMEERRMNLEIE